MIETKNIKNILDEAKEYAEAKVELTKLEVIEKLSEVMANSISQLVIGAIVLLFLFIFSIFSSLWIGSQMESYWHGFGIVSLIYLVVAVVFFIFRHQLLKNPIQNTIIRQLFKESDDH